ncbi:MAG: hypothetical protein KatS3mg077_2783 [Candidatus Binatia bacterium]|nr:MAG: hypothetical protein KatS3mg077_2783 [Candidatus Binatia bacterium]
MRQVRWVGWTMAVAAALCVGTSWTARADIASDKPAAVVVYPKVQVVGANGVDTTIRLANTNTTNPIHVHCYYINASSYCVGGTNAGQNCTLSPTVCTGGGVCLPSWQETDFRIVLTAGQPIEWIASRGLSDNDLPLPRGVCVRNPTRQCGSDADCNPFPGGTCTQSNAGTRIPPVPDDPFVGELRCIAIDPQGNPIPRNDLKGEGQVVTVGSASVDIAGYNAIGIQATGNSDGVANQLTLGPGRSGEYNGCPNYLIVDHFFDGARNPVPGTNAGISTNLVLVPCSTDYLRQIPGLAVAQYLVFNEFEQRFSTSRAVRCYQDIPLSRIDTANSARSIWNVSVAGTLTGQTRVNPIGVPSSNPPSIPSGLLGIAVETHTGTVTKSGAFNIHMAGDRDAADVMIIP